MTIEVRKWLAFARALMDEDVAAGLHLGAYYLYVGLWLTRSTRLRFAAPAFEYEWTCWSCWTLAGPTRCRLSPTSTTDSSTTRPSGRWAAPPMSGSRTLFDCAYVDIIARAAYVTASPHSKAVFGDQLLPPQYVPVPGTWPDWDPVAPEEAARRGVGRRARRAAGRCPTVDGDDPVSKTCAEPFEALRRAEADREVLWDRYLDNLRLVLGEVEHLLGNVDADRAVVTADHGEAFDKWGFYEHPVGWPLPAAKRVPRVEATVTDRGTRDPSPGATSTSSYATWATAETLRATAGRPCRGGSR